MPTQKKHTFHAITFGCQMNVNDSQWLARALHERDFEEAPLANADVVFLNTCSVRGKPEHKVYSTIGMVRQANPKALIAVAGCVAQQVGERLFKRGVRLVLGSDGIVAAPDAIERLLAEPQLKLSFLDFTTAYPDRPHYLHQGAPSQAFVNIMQGCDNFCAYCIVPYTRGPRKSRSTAAVLAECRAWLDQGVCDITLLGQNVNSFGLDPSGDGTSFADLLHQVAALPGLACLHFVSAHPRDMSPATIEAFALPVLSPRLHLPLQSGSDSVLSRMGRGYTLSHFLDLISRVRRIRPELAVSSDLIVGFPGETEAEFADTLAAIQAAPFISSYSFCYSDRPGTRASSMPFKVPAPVQLERLSRLQNLQDQLTVNWLQSHVGTTTTITLEAPNPKNPAIWQARDPWANLVHIPLPLPLALPLPACGGSALPAGPMKARIVAAQKHCLIAEKME